MSESNVTADREQAQRVVGAWFETHVDTIHRYAARRLGEHDAWDVVAETFRIALERFDAYDPQRGHERAWLYGIASNVIRRHTRTEARRLRTRARALATQSDTPIDPLIDTDHRLDAITDAEHIAIAVAALNSDDRDLLFLIAWERLSSTEVGEVLNIPAATVRSRLRRIRHQIALPKGDSGE